MSRSITVQKFWIATYFFDWKWECSMWSKLVMKLTFFAIFYHTIIHIYIFTHHVHVCNILHFYSSNNTTGKFVSKMLVFFIEIVSAACEVIFEVMLNSHFSWDFIIQLYTICIHTMYNKLNYWSLNHANWESFLKVLVFSIYIYVYFCSKMRVQHVKQIGYEIHISREVSSYNITHSTQCKS